MDDFIKAGGDGGFTVAPPVDATAEHVTIGDMSTARLMGMPVSALLVGIFCGLSEQALPGAVSQRAAQFFSEVEKRAGTPPPARPLG